MKKLQYQRQTINIIGGASLKGYIKASYEELVKVFGEPNTMPYEFKINHIWVVNIEGVVAHIYDYKDDLNTGEKEDWHIGAKQEIAVRLIEQVIKENK